MSLLFALAPAAAQTASFPATPVAVPVTPQVADGPTGVNPSTVSATNGPIVAMDGTSGDIKTIDPTTNPATVTVICPAASCVGTNFAAVGQDDRPETTPDGQTVIFKSATGLSTVPVGGVTTTTSALSTNASASDTSVQVAANPGSAKTILIDTASPSPEIFTVTSVSGTGPYTVTLSGALSAGHPSGTPVALSSVTHVPGTVPGDEDPSYTGDDSKIVYLHSPCDQPPGSTPTTCANLFTIPATGGTPAAVSGAPLGQCIDEPQVSPNGATVAYLDNCNLDSLTTIPTAGGSTNVVDANLRESDQISWSPDGTKLLVADPPHCGFTHELGIISSTASNGTPTCLADSVAEEDASFSPDGTEIVLEDSSDLAEIINADGTGSATVLQGTSDFDDHYWAPAKTTPTLSITGPSPIAKPPSGSSTTVNFTVSISVAPAAAVTVNWATQDDTAKIGTDYCAGSAVTSCGASAASGQLTFPANSTASQTIPVTVLGGAVNPSDIDFFAVLSNPSANATILHSTATATISALPTLTINDPPAASRPGGTSTITFQVTLSATSTSNVVVGYATHDGLAKAGIDYTAATGTLIFLPGTTSKTIPVSFSGRQASPQSKLSDIDFTLKLSNPTGATLAKDTGSGMILIPCSGAAPHAVTPFAESNWKMVVRIGGTVAVSFFPSNPFEFSPVLGQRLLSSDDTLRTASDARAQVQTADGSVATVGPDLTLTMCALDSGLQRVIVEGGSTAARVVNDVRAEHNGNQPYQINTRSGVLADQG